jgi:hypothetical protein
MSIAVGPPESDRPEIVDVPVTVLASAGASTAQYSIDANSTGWTPIAQIRR